MHALADLLVGHLTLFAFGPAAGRYQALAARLALPLPQERENVELLAAERRALEKAGAGPV